MSSQEKNALTPEECLHELRNEINVVCLAVGMGCPPYKVGEQQREVFLAKALEACQRCNGLIDRLASHISH
jgi:hypothetical protein